LSSGYGGQSLILCLLTSLTAFWLVLQSFVVKEDLFSGGPDKDFSAVHALYIPIVEFTLGLNIGSPDFFVRGNHHLFNHDLLPWARSRQMVSCKHR
jgi:hypothetical protein